MSNTIEIEAKALVSQDEYRKLAKLFRGSPRYVQTNYYIDTEDRLLAKEGVALRIRGKDFRRQRTELDVDRTRHRDFKTIESVRHRTGGDAAREDFHSANLIRAGKIGVVPREEQGRAVADLREELLPAASGQHRTRFRGRDEVELRIADRLLRRLVFRNDSGLSRKNV